MHYCKQGGHSVLIERKVYEIWNMHQQHTAIHQSTLDKKAQQHELGTPYKLTQSACLPALVVSTMISIQAHFVNTCTENLHVETSTEKFLGKVRQTTKLGGPNVAGTGKPGYHSNL